MAEIRYDINVEGAEEGARSLGTLTVVIKESGEAADGAGKKFNKAGDEIENAGDKSSAAADAVDMLKGGFAAAATVVASAAAAFAAAGAAFVALSTEVERRAGIMRQFSGSLTEVQARTNGLVSSLEAMAVANRLASAGIQLTGRDLANVMVAAITSAQERGEDLSQTIDQLAEALGGASADELRKFGVEVQTGASRTATLTQALDQLDRQYGETEAQAASFGAVLAQIENIASDFTTTFIEVTSAAEDLGTEWNQLMEDFGLAELTLDRIQETVQSVAIAFGAVFVESLIRARQEITDFLQTFEQVRRAVLSGNFREAMDAASGFGDRFQRRGDAMGDRIADRSRAFGVALGMSRDEGERRSRTRRIRRDGGTASDQPTLDELMDGASGGFGSLIDDISGDATEGIDALDEARKESEQLAHDMHEREKERIAELTERRKAAAEEEYELAREQMQKTADDAMGVLGPAMSGLTDVLSNVIAGTESADHAFQGLLASFLEMISQKAALEAAGQFAAAVASFASQDYGGGALHLAAGVAWTAVAVAAGAASVAVAPPAASAQPANPQQNATPGGGGGDTIVNLNGAVVTAGTRAELGRELGTLIEAGGRRFGRAA